MHRQNATVFRDRAKGGAAAKPAISEADELYAAEVAVPLAVRPKVACRMLSCGITRLYELLGADELQSYLDGRSRLITVASIHVYVARKIAEMKAPRPHEP